jgi:hypothetical protein
MERQGGVAPIGAHAPDHYPSFLLLPFWDNAVYWENLEVWKDGWSRRVGWRPEEYERRFRSRKRPWSGFTGVEGALRLLASHGVFQRSGGNYAHNTLSRALRSDHPHSMRAYVRLVGLPLFWKSWGELEQAVRSGKPWVADIFGYRRQQRPAAREVRPIPADCFGRQASRPMG